MGAIISRLKERLTAVLFRPESAEVRDARADRREVNREAGLEAKEQKAEQKGDAAHVQSLLAGIAQSDMKKATRLFDTLVQIRLITSRLLKQQEYLKQAVQMDQGITQDLRREVLSALEDDRQGIATLVQSIFRSETSFDSITIALAQLQDLPSQAQELYFSAVKIRREGRKTRRTGKKLIKGARARQGDASFHARFTEYQKHLDEEMRFLAKEARYTILMLQEDQHDLQAKEEHLRQLIERAGFPKQAGKDTLQFYDDALVAIHRTLQEEIAKKRLELSDIERAA